MNRILNKNSFPILLFPLIFILFMGGGFNKAQSQEARSALLNYVSPVPGSKFILPQNNIAIRHGDPIKAESLQNFSIQVFGSKSGIISGKIVLSNDTRTIIFKPDKPFALGEKVQVSISDGLETETGLLVEQKNFSFFITSSIPDFPANYFFKKEIVYNNNKTLVKNNKSVKKSELKDNNLPEGFPNIIINVSNNPPIGEYYFITPWTYEFATDPFLIICDPHGIPLYFRKGEVAIFNFQLQSNGLLSFSEADQGYKNIIMDSAYHLIDYYQMGNGYDNTDPHDFQVLENGHAFVLGTDWQIYAMDTVVPGGHPNALVCGFVFQEQDADKNVIFQWRSWDHFEITDAGPQIDLTEFTIDYVHGNAIEVESDTSVIISSRSLDEITKIHRNTGEIIWRFGGKKNQFNFQNDTLGFTMQHDCRRLQNGHVTLFDNGTMHPDPKFSSALEYQLDEINFEATLISRLRRDPDIYGNAMGSVQWTNDSAVVIGWGNGTPGITEFNLDGEINMEIKFQGVSYRAFRFPWKSTYFTTNTDSLNFEAYVSDSLISEVEIYNNNGFEIEITSVYNEHAFFNAVNQFPLVIPANDTGLLYVQFKADSAGTFNDVLTINSDINADTLVQRIAQQVYLEGNATPGQSVNQYNKKHFLVHPNPAHNELIVESSAEAFSGLVLLQNVMGKMVAKQKVDNRRKIRLDISQLPNGIYFVCLIRENNKSSENYKIVKY